MSAAKKFVPSNPGGKPGRIRGHKMVDKIAQATDDGVLMVNFFVRCLKGIEKGTNVSHKIRAAEWLADRFAGKAVEVALTGEFDSANNPLAELDAEQLRALIHKIVPKKGKAEQPETARPADPLAENSGQVGAYAHTQPAETPDIYPPKPTEAHIEREDNQA
jgi:hypothetical protein